MAQTISQNSTGKYIETSAMLRILASVARRVADGEAIDKAWLIEQITAAGKSKSDEGGSPPLGPLLTVTEASEKLRVSRWSIYDLIHKKQLLSVKIGRRRFVPSNELARYVNSLPLHGGQLL